MKKIKEVLGVRSRPQNLSLAPCYSCLADHWRHPGLGWRDLRIFPIFSYCQRKGHTQSSLQPSQALRPHRVGIQTPIDTLPDVQGECPVSPASGHTTASWTCLCQLSCLWGSHFCNVGDTPVLQLGFHTQGRRECCGHQNP